MSVELKDYACGTRFRIQGYFGIVDITPQYATVVKRIVENAFNNAEDEIEKQLYKQGLMTCNAMLRSIAEMKEHGNDLVQAYIKKLDEKYEEESK